MVNLPRTASIAVAICLTVAIALSGCNSNGAESGTDAGEAAEQPTKASDTNETPTSQAEEQKGIVLDPNKKVKLRYYTQSYYDQVEFELAYPEWQKRYPNIEVELMMASPDYDTKVKMAMMAGEPVDIIYTGTTYTLERVNPDNLYLPLDEFIARDGWDVNAEFGADYLQQLVVNDKQYALPRALNPNGVWYNKRLFEEAGIPDPSSGDWTWEQFFQIAKQLSKYDKDGKNSVFGVHIAIFENGYLADTAQNIALYGGWEMLHDDGSFNQDWSKLKTAVQYLYNAIYVDKSMASPTEILARNLHWQNDFYANKNAMAIGGRVGAIFTDLAVEYGQVTPEDDEAYIHTLAPMPRWDAGSPKKLADEVVTGVAMSRTTKYPDETYAFMKFLSTDSILISSKAAHRIPVSKSIDRDVLMENWRWYENSNGELVQGKNRDDLYTRMMDPEIKSIFMKNTLKYSYTGKMEQELEKQLSLLFANETTVDEAIENAKIAAFNIYYDETQVTK